MPTNHQTDLSIWRMLLNRLPFLPDTPDNQTLASHFTLETMYELEVCFQIDEDTPAADPTRVGDEQYYSIPQRSVIADIVACYILMLYFGANMGGISANNNGGTPVAPSKFLSKAKAGSVEVEWEQFKVKDTAALVTTGPNLLDRYKASAMRKARKLGCILDVCDDCSISVECARDSYVPHPFIIVTGGETNCGCGGSGINNIEKA